MSRDPTTEERIFEAARRVFLQQGPQARMQDVAKEAGITQSLLHYYYRSRDRLFQAVFRKEASRLIPREIGILNSDLSIEEKVETIVKDYLDFLLENPHLPPFVAYEINYHPERLQEFVRSVGKPDLKKLGQQIGERVASGTMKFIPPEQFLVNLLSLCIFPFMVCPMLQSVLEFDDKAFAGFIEERKRHLPEFFLNALRSDAASP